MSEAALKIAVIGGGVAGIVSSYILQQRHAVTLFEKNDYVGGHTNTIEIPDGPDAGTAVDTGFIVCNDKTYPNFHRFLERLDVPWRWSDMSFGFHDEVHGLQYAGTNFDGLFAQRTNLIKPAFIGMLLEIRRFSRTALADLESSDLERVTLGNYLKRHRFSAYFVRNYLVPMGAAIWSTSPGKMLRFPAATFVRFFKNHGLLSLQDRPRWQTVAGGSQQYVRAFLKEFRGEVRTRADIAAVNRADDRITVRHGDGSEEHFDRVVFATHADQVLRLLADPSEEERRLFGAWRYERNRVVLHTDRSVMPPNRRAWASWNYTREVAAQSGNALSMTYHMNRLQGLRTKRQYFVTLNRKAPIREEHIIRDIVYTHPLYTRKSLATQTAISELSGTRGTHFAGSYLGYGFHEDAVRSAVEVGRQFDLAL